MTPRRESTWLALLLAAYAGSRLIALGSLPPFIDEAGHIAWARETLQGRLLAGSWGGRWLTIKVMAAFVALPIHPLLAARLATVVAGAGALAACILVGRRLYSRTEGLVAGLLFVALPYALLYNRLALAETFAAAFAAAVIYLSVVAAASIHRRDVAALAVALVAMLLAKLYTIVLALVPVAAVVTLHPRSSWGRRLLRLSPALAAVVLVYAVTAWRGHGTQYLEQQLALGDLRSQAALIERNLLRIGDWFWRLLTPPLAVVSLTGLLWTLRRGRLRADLFLAVVLLLSVAPFVPAARIWFPRYLVPALVPLCVLLARCACIAASDLWRRTSGLDRRLAAAGLAAAACGMLAWPLWLDARILLHPEQAPLPAIERAQLFEGWSSGYGVPELAEDLRRRSLANAGGIDVVRFYFWNQAYWGLDVFLSPSAALGVHTIDPASHEAAATLARLAAGRPTFFVLNPPNDAGHLAEIGKSVDNYLRGAARVWHYQRPGGKSSLEVWRLAAAAEEEGGEAEEGRRSRR